MEISRVIVLGIKKGDLQQVFLIGIPPLLGVGIHTPINGKPVFPLDNLQ